jgi:hypothetical protein
VSERDSGWKASVDGVVSDFDAVTRRLRRRQRQVLRLAWSAVGVTTLAMGSLIVLNMPPGSAGAPVGPMPALALLDPTGSGPIPNQDGGAPLLAGIGIVPPSPGATTPPTDATAPVTMLASAPRRTAAVPPAAPPAPVADTSPVTAVLPPPADQPPTVEQPPSSPPAPAGLVDGLVTGVVQLLS